MAEDKVENGQEQEATKTDKNVPEETKSEEKVEKVEQVTETSEEAEAEEKAESEVEKKEATPEILKRIKDQIEFYFGNVNMQRDKFLNEQSKLDEGWIPLSVMLNFKMLASISKDLEVILKALEDSDLMEVSEDKKKIRRSPKHPLPVYDEEYKKSQEERSVYVKGFPQDNTSITTLKEFFAPYEPIEHIFMRRYKDKSDKSCFKGSIFVQFATLDAAKSFMELESLKYEDTELIRKFSKDYTVDKAKEREELRSKRDKKKGKDSKSTEKEDKEKENEKESFNLPKGVIIHISGLSNGTSREDIREEITKLDGNVAFIEYNKGNTDAWVRLQEENTAKTVVDEMDNGKFTLNGNEVTCRVLEGEEEETYLAKVKQEIKNLRSQRHNKFRGGRRGGFDKKRGRSPASKDESARKKAKC